MKTVTLTLSDELAGRMEETAKARKSTIDQWMQATLERESRAEFARALHSRMQAQLARNPELYSDDIKEWEATLMDGLEYE